MTCDTQFQWCGYFLVHGHAGKEVHAFILWKKGTYKLIYRDRSSVILRLPKAIRNLPTGFDKGKTVTRAILIRMAKDARRTA